MDKNEIDPVITAYLTEWQIRTAVVRRTVADFDDDKEREWYKSLIPEASEFVESMTRDELRDALMAAANAYAVAAAIRAAAKEAGP